MLDDEDRKAETWRKRATEIRAIAEEFECDRARTDLLELAAQWEEMADRLEAHMMGLQLRSPDDPSEQPQ